MKRKLPYSTPEGYFEQLRTSLEAIPQRAQKVSPWQKVSPYLALAAVFAAAFVIAHGIFSRTALPSASKEDVIEYYIDSELTLAQLEEAVYYLDE